MSVLVNELALDAQRSVLGAMLLDPETVGPMLHQLTPEDFIDGHYRAVFQAMKKLQGQGTTPDIMTVNDALGGGFRDTLNAILTTTVTAANAEEYAVICREQALKYRMAELGERLMETAGQAGSSSEDIQAVADQIAALTCQKPGVRITDLAQCFEEFLDRHADGKRPAYFTWGFSDLDRLIYIEPGDFVVLGGYPSAGKTALALQMVFHIAREKRVGYFYYENNDKKLFDRLVALKARVSFGKIKRYDLQEEDFQEIIALQKALTSPSLEFVDASGMTVADLRALALSRRYDLVVADYLQKIPAGRGKRNFSEFERVTEVSSGLQDLGKQTGVTVLALSQLTRPERKNGNTPPGMHSFRQSGQIEQDADVALLLYRENEDNPENAVRELKIGKNKEGEANIVLGMRFDGDTQTFSRAALRPAPPKGRQKPRQVDFWDGLEEDDNPFQED